MTREDRQLIEDVFGGIAGHEGQLIDPLWNADGTLRTMLEDGRIDGFIAEVDDVLSTARGRTISWDEMPTSAQQVEIVDGTGDLYSLLQGLRHRALTLSRTASRPHRPHYWWDGLTPPRESSFLDERREVHVRDRIWNAHADEINALTADSGWLYLHLYEDFSADGPTGHVKDLRSAGASGADTADVYEVTGAVLVVDRDDDGIARPVRSFPEIPLDENLRRTFPGLCHFLGGWFGRDAYYPFYNARYAMLNTEPPAFDQVRDELDRLLAEDPDDDRCRAVAEACGSYVLPQRARHWVDLLRWRFDGYDWTENR